MIQSQSIFSAGDLATNVAGRMPKFLEPAHTKALVELFDENKERLEHSFRSPRYRSSDEVNGADSFLQAREQGLFEYKYDVLRVDQIADEMAIQDLDGKLKSSEVMQAIYAWSGLRVNNFRYVGLTCYTGTDYLGPHSDGASDRWGEKLLAVNVSLQTSKTRNNSGDLVYIIDGHEKRLWLSEESLTLFRVGRLGVHYVPPVPDNERRLSVVGFYYA